jgi:hypothetical protein
MSNTSSTAKLVSALKQSGQDWEWYPTTDRMIEVVMSHIPKNANSILDIGAGDGRVLEKLKEKCEFATLYSIEISMILVERQAKDIIPLGADLYEQNLSALPVDFIFCNPVYSEYEEWVCKIIEQGFAKRAYLVIPQRWKDSKLIAGSLNKRGATARVIHSSDFHNAERQARAVIDIVEICYPKDQWGDKPKDPFDIWFDKNIDTFDKVEELKEDETSEELVCRYSHSNIEEMVAAYREEYDRMEENYRAIFRLDYAILKELGVDKDHIREGLKKRMSGLKVKYWGILFKRLDVIVSRLTAKSSQKLLDKLTSNIVDFTASNVYAVVLWAIKNANQYFEEQLIDLFYQLSTFEGVHNYMSNQRTWEKDGWRYNSLKDGHTHYTLDYRIVVSKWEAIRKDQYRTWDYPGGLHRSSHELLTDIIAVMTNLGFATHSTSSYNRAWVGGEWQDWHDTYTGEILFQAKAYLNGNVHFRFMPDAIKALNIEVGRLLKWIRTGEEVVTEMGYTRKDAEKYFGRNARISVSNLPMLMSPSEEPAPQVVEEVVEEPVEKAEEIEEDSSQEVDDEAIDKFANEVNLIQKELL